MHEAYPSHCATCFSQPLLIFCFQKELNVSSLKGFFFNGHRPNDFDHRLRIKTNTVTTNNWYQKCFVWIITLWVCSETQKKAKLVTRQNFVYSFQSLNNLISILKLNNQYRRKVLLRSFYLIDHRLETKKGFIWIVTQHDFVHRLRMLTSSKSTLGGKGEYLRLEKKFWAILPYFCWLAMFFFAPKLLEGNMIFRYILICAIGWLQFSLA